MKNDFFGFCIPLARFIYIMPDKTPQNVYGWRNKLWAVFMYGLAVFCHLTEIIKLFQIVTAKYFLLGEFIRNFVITSLHFTSLGKAMFIGGKTGKKAFEKILDFEKHVYKNLGDDIRLIYKNKVTSIQKVKKYYLIGIILVVIFYVAAPIFREPIHIQDGNQTIRFRQVPLSSWSPFEQYYWLTFIWTGLTGIYLSIFFVTTDLICYSYVQMINEGMKNLMVLDFLPGSVQLAGMIYQMMTNLSVIQCILLGQFICSLIARVFIYSNSANNLSQLSKQLAVDWFEIDWTELPKDVTNNLNFCIMRSQKNLQITVGDLSVITMESFLTILKGTYSYLMLLMTI
uniref:Odorant receptor n=1 Tax=Dendroctonus ponderosae TaxID=77166 RepID=R9PSS6_DENPD